MATSSQALAYAVSAGRSSNHPLCTTQLTYASPVTPCANLQFNSHPDVQLHFPTEIQCNESLTAPTNSLFQLQSMGPQVDSPLLLQPVNLLPVELSVVSPSVQPSVNLPPVHPSVISPPYEVPIYIAICSTACSTIAHRSEKWSNIAF